MAQRLYNLAQWWHLLSLDAPTVAALWSWFFARAMHLRLPMFASALLALGTWLLYVADRILDGMRQQQGEFLRARHHFHARHRKAFLLASAGVGMGLIVVLLRMGAEALRENSVLGVLALFYFFIVHRGRGASVYLPKELAVALLFAAATAVPAWSHLGSGREQLVPAVASFASICWINCVGIEKWEGGTSPVNVHAHGMTRWAMLHLRSIVTVIALFLAFATLRAPSRGLQAVYLAGIFSSALLFILDARSPSLSPLRVRIAADAALLTPLALLPFAR